MTPLYERGLNADEGDCSGLENGSEPLWCILDIVLLAAKPTARGKSRISRLSGWCGQPDGVGFIRPEKIVNKRAVLRWPRDARRVRIDAACTGLEATVQAHVDAATHLAWRDLKSLLSLCKPAPVTRPKVNEHDLKALIARPAPPPGRSLRQSLFLGDAR